MIKKLKSLQNHQGFMKYFKNTSWLFGEKILRMVVGLFVGIWVARYLGPEQFGIFNYALSFVGLFGAFASLGIDSIVIRELVKGEKDKQQIIVTSFYIKMIGSFIVLLMLFIAIKFTSNDDLTNLIIFIIAFGTIFQAFNIIDLFFQSKVLSQYVVFSNIIVLSISSIIKIALILNEASLIYFAYVFLFDSIILALGLIYFFIKTSFIKIDYFLPNISLVLALLRDSWPLILSGLVVSIYMRIDQVMIQEIMGSEAVGQYAAAVRISELWYFIPMVVVSSLFPAIINAKKQSQELYKTRLQKLYDLMVWMSILIAVPMTFLSDWVVDLLYGEQYSQAGSVLMIHIWTGVFVFIGVAFSNYLINENLTKKSFYRTALGALSNVGLNFILIPKYGINGAAIATLLSQIIANYIYDFFDKDLHQQLKMKTMCFFPIHILKGYK